MNENENYNDRPQTIIDTFVDSLIRDTANHFLDWKIDPEYPGACAPAFYLEGRKRLYLIPVRMDSEKDDYRLSYVEDGETTIIMEEMSLIDHPNVLRRLYWEITHDFADEPTDPLMEQIRAYMRQSQERYFQSRIMGNDLISAEKKHILIMHLFEMCDADIVTQLYLNALEDEDAPQMAIEERERLSELASATITIIRQTRLNPRKVVFSIKHSSSIAHGFDGENGYLRLNSGLNRIANAYCAWPFELDPEFAFSISHCDTLRKKERDRLYETINRTCALLLLSILKDY